MKLLILLIIILILMFSVGVVLLKKRETMTKVRRGVGFGNDADEIPVASGIIHSAPLLDYTHTWWDGSKQESCDACNNPDLCPECPNVAPTKDVGVFYSKYNSEAGALGGRERMGASSGKPPRKLTSTVDVYRETFMSEPAEEAFSKTRMITRGQHATADDDAEIKQSNHFLYHDIMGLDIDDGPAPENKEIPSYNGYVYKEPFSEDTV